MTNMCLLEVKVSVLSFVQIQPQMWSMKRLIFFVHFSGHKLQNLEAILPQKGLLCH